MEEQQLDFHDGIGGYRCLHRFEYCKIWNALLFEYLSFNGSAAFELLWIFKKFLTLCPRHLNANHLTLHLSKIYIDQ